MEAITEPLRAPQQDPEVRPDGKCAHCLKPRITKKERAAAKGDVAVSRTGKKGRPLKPRIDIIAERERDPFCSVKCAKAWHGVVDTTPVLPLGRKPQLTKRSSRVS